MKIKLITLITVILTSSIIYGQTNLEHISDSILTEASRIYRLEKAVWKSKEDILESYSKKYLRKEITGAISYISNDTVITILWKNQDENNIIKNTYYFKNTDSLAKINSTNKSRQPSETELQLINIWTKIIQDISEKPEIYNKPEKSHFEIIITQNENNFNTYLLVEFKQKTFVPIGNDYLLGINSDGIIINRDRLHKSFLKTPFSKSNGNRILNVFHTHFDYRPYITATDICIVRLYSGLLNWENLIIVSKYISTYNIDENTLQIELYEEED